MHADEETTVYSNIIQYKHGLKCEEMVKYRGLNRSSEREDEMLHHLNKTNIITEWMII